jgi:hypothetical protein
MNHRKDDAFVCDYPNCGKSLVKAVTLQRTPVNSPSSAQSTLPSLLPCLCQRLCPLLLWPLLRLRRITCSPWSRPYLYQTHCQGTPKICFVLLNSPTPLQYNVLDGLFLLAALLSFVPSQVVPSQAQHPAPSELTKQTQKHISHLFFVWSHFPRPEANDRAARQSSGTRTVAATR